MAQQAMHSVFRCGCQGNSLQRQHAGDKLLTLLCPPRLKAPTAASTAVLLPSKEILPPIYLHLKAAAACKTCWQTSLHLKS